MHQNFRNAMGAFAAAAVVVFAATGQAQDTRVVVVTHDAAPGGNGTFVSRFGSPPLNDAGQVAFTGFLTTRVSGFFRGDGTTLTQIMLTGDAAPDGNGGLSSFADFFPPALNGAGQVAFNGNLLGTSGGFRDANGIFRGDGTTLTQIARGGDAAPDGNGSLLSLGVGPLNEAGQMAFTAILIDTSGGGSDDNGIFRSDGVNALVQIAREGQAAPDGNGVFSHVSSSALNEAGQVAFVGGIDLGDGGSVQDDFGIFRGDGTPGSLIRIAREGEATPDANGNLSFFDYPTLNNAGQVAFQATLIGTHDGTSDDGGIFRGDGATALVQIAREGQAPPDGNGRFSSFRRPVLNDAGQVAFSAQLSDTAGGSSDDIGLFLGDGQTALVQFAREGLASPDGNGNFLSFSEPALNDAGQAAFFALLNDTTGGTSDDSGIFFFDGSQGLHQVAREGDDLLGGTITALSFVDASHSDLPGQRGYSGLNSLGQIAFRFSLHDGREGIAIWTVPEPASLALLGMGVLSLLLRRSDNPRTSAA